uniref:Uncharacterized protein n=1 Tax=Magallana gigas TaxID=29159 RepID=A0A8W8JBS4_MAGGI
MLLKKLKTDSCYHMAFTAYKEKNGVKAHTGMKRNQDVKNVRWVTMILTVLKPAAFRSMEKTVRVNATATTDCVTINWVVRNIKTLSNLYHHMEHQSISVTQPQNW